MAFPCNNFNNQEPGTNSEIYKFATVEKGATYPILGKLDCENGQNTHPLYVYLKKSLGAGMFGEKLKWNFSKFLCDANGVPVKRYAPVISPLGIEKDILKLLNK